MNNCIYCKIKCTKDLAICFKCSKNPFNVEEYRNLLAIQKDYFRLKELYKPSYAEIKNLNTSKLWDELNLKTNNYIPKSNPMAHDRTTIVGRLIKGHKLNVLNIGFGSANLEEYFFHKNNIQHKEIKWYGIELSSESVRSAKARYRLGNFKTGNILDIKYKNNLFDYVIVLEVLEHVSPSDTFRALQEILRVLKPSGKLIISVPLSEDLKTMISHNYNPNAHVRIYTSSLIFGELQMVGFFIIKKQFLYAYHNWYYVKKLLTKLYFRKITHPNNVIIVARKK
jgi:ubiquinone/menaquinone biosynthesis C-methylase UbiE